MCIRDRLGDGERMASFHSSNMTIGAGPRGVETCNFGRVSITTLSQSGSYLGISGRLNMPIPGVYAIPAVVANIRVYIAIVV